jgi:hypothetical protein
MLVIPSCLTAEDEDDIILSFRRALGAVFDPVVLSAVSLAQPNTESPAA